MKHFFLVLFLLIFLSNFVSAACNTGGICTIALMQGRVESFEINDLKKFDFIIASNNAFGHNESTPNILDVVDDSVPVVMYDIFTERAKNVNPSDSWNAWTEIDTHNDWFWLDNSGQRINRTDFPNLYEMDVRNSAYQDFSAQRLQNLLALPELSKLDGFFLDQTNNYSNWVLYQLGNSSCASNCPVMTQSEFENGVNAILQKMKNKISSKLLTINGNYSGYASSVDAQMWEGWMHAPWDNSSYFFPKSVMIEQLNYLSDARHANKKVFVLSGNASTDTKIRNFAFAAYLIAKRNDSYAYFNYSDPSTATKVDYFPELYDLDLGNALGDYSVQSNVYVRNFEKGKVLLNIENSSSTAINLGGNFRKLDGTIVSSVSLAEHSGIILLNAVCDADNDGYNSAACSGNDCNDGNPNIHPNAADICGNSIDEDCSGADVSCLSTCGNGTIESGENCSTCPADISCSTGTICCNAVCSAANCSADAQCNDNNPSTIDKCINPNSCNSSCSNANNSIANILCGNNRIDSGENCSSCPSDVSCVAGRVCRNASCVLPVCSSNAECNDNDSCTIDSCSSNGCSYSSNPDCSLRAMSLSVPEKIIDGEKFVVTVVGSDKKPVVGVNIVYGKQAGFTDLFGRIELEADKQFTEITASKIDIGLASAQITVLEPEKIKLEEFYDFSGLKELASNPVVFLSVFGIILGIGFFIVLISSFKNQKNEY